MKKMINLSITVRIILICVILGACVLYFILRALRDRKNNPEIVKTTVRLSIVFTGIVILIILLFTQVFMINIVPSGSMEPTIMTGDIVLSTRRGLKDIDRYDIVVFKDPDDESTFYIKRVIGLPGETITVEGGCVYADGILLEDSFIKEEMNSLGDGNYVVPKDCYFMLGDNRNASKDSRFWENKYVTNDEILAKAMVVLLPISDFQLLY